MEFLWKQPQKCTAACWPGAESDSGNGKGEEPVCGRETARGKRTASRCNERKREEPEEGCCRKSASNTGAIFS